MITIVIEKNAQNEKEIAVIQEKKLIEYYKGVDEDSKKEGNIYIGTVRSVIKGMQSAFIDIGTGKNSFIHLKDILPKVDVKKENVDMENEETTIEKLVKVGQQLLVQVKKDSNQKKGARVSTHINITGKYVAFMPNTDIITVSQKIEEQEERERLVKIVEENAEPGNGYIIRTSARGKKEEIIKDIKKLESKWNKIISTTVKEEKNAQLIYSSENVVEKILLDLVEKEEINIITNDEEEESKIKRLIEIEEYINVSLEKEKTNKLLEKYGMSEQIAKLNKNRIWLKNGGFITVDPTEALTAIDVNTGKYTGKKDLETTVFTVNKEATKEIAHQIRLRDVGGIIIIDYIDMKNKEHKNEIERLLREELKKDRAKTQIEGFTKLELMELTRKHICSHNDNIDWEK